MRLKAAAIQQLDATHFSATNALVTTSRLEEPAYDVSSNQLTFTDVQQPVVDPITGVPLRQAVVEGDPARCARLLDGLRGEGAAPPLVLWALANETRSLANLCAGRDAGQPLPALFKAERIFEPRRQQAIGRALGRLTQGGLRAALMHAARIDRMIKGLTAGDVWDEFLQLALRLARRG